jgi:3-oxoacyl-[acyl-carrier-protein] synthase-3
MGSRIRKIEYFLPNSVLDNKQLEKEYSDWSAEKIEKKVGIKERHVAREDETALDLAQKAAEKLFQTYDRDKIDFLLFCTQSPDYYLPSCSCILQNRLKLRRNIGALDYNLGCSGFVYGLALAKGLIASHIAKSILLITAETYTKYIHPLDKSTRTIFGDAASAIIIEWDKEEHIHNFVLGTDGSGFKNLIVPNGGLRNRYDPTAKEILDESGNIRTDNNLYMNGPEIFNFTIEIVPKALHKILALNNISKDSVDYFVLHQANKYILDYLRRKLKINKDKFYINLHNTGNTVSSSIPIALRDCFDQKIIKLGDKVLIFGFGVGYSWCGTIITI